MFLSFKIVCAFPDMVSQVDVIRFKLAPNFIQITLKSAFTNCNVSTNKLKNLQLQSLFLVI